MNIPEWIAGCMEVERRMSEIYALLEDKFPKERTLFSTLNEEEMRHIQTLSLVEPTDDYGAKDLSREARMLLRTLDAADTFILKAKFTPLQLEEALRTALGLEEGVVENFATSLPRMGEELSEQERVTALYSDSTRHADMLREALVRNGYMRLS